MSRPEESLSFEVLAERLKQEARGLNEAFNRFQPEQWQRCLRRELRKLNQLIGGTDMLLFRMARPKNSDPFVRLLGRATKPTPDSGQLKQRFAFRLLPANIQEGLNGSANIRISLAAGAGGRMLQEMQTPDPCEYAVIVPLLSRSKKLAGFVLCLSDQDYCSNLPELQMSRLTDLVRLYGTLLQTNVMRLRKQWKRNRELNQWRQIANNACDFAMRINANLNVEDVIPFGATDATPPVGGLRLTDIVERTFHRRLLKQILFVRQERETRTMEFRIVLGAEDSTWYHARIEPSQADDQSVMMYLTDNNRDKRMQSEINLLNDQLIRASRLSLLGQMSTEFAHQLNQPLQAILGFCNLIQTRTEKGIANEASTGKALGQIETSVIHAGNIIDSIRNFARYRTLNVQAVPLNQILENAIMMVMDRASQSGGEFVVHPIPNDCVVMADETQTTHVFINLFVNALEASSEFGVQHPLITISLRPSETSDRTCVAVKDNGPGISEEEPERIFEKFHTNKEEGLGLGLAISREVCESQGGSLTVENNTHGSGCTFLVSFRVSTDSGEFAIVEGDPDEDSTW